MKSVQTIPFKGDYINGEFRKPQNPDLSWKIYSPSDLKDLVIEIESNKENASVACQEAKAAYKKWSHTTIAERKNLILKLKNIFIERANEMAETIAREVGKPLWESLTEAKALASKIDITVEHSMKLVSDETVKDALPGITGVIRHKSRGVMAVIGPFNFPAHLPNGHIIPALLTGNTIVFKPSDKTPAVGQLYAEFFHQAGFPPGVFNLVQGQSEVGRRLVQEENVDGILFTGSYEVGQKIKQDTLDHYWKLLALEMGGKNSTIVWEDADLEKAVYETLIGAYLTSGQRCSCTSKIILHKKIYEKFLSNFHAAAKNIEIGHWSENIFMGPLISKDSVEKYLRFQEIAKRESAESLMRGKILENKFEGHYVTPSINLVKKYNSKSLYQKSEIFGPNVAVYAVDEYEECLEVVNAGGFGLVAAIFTKNKALYEKALIDAKVGLLNWNRTTNGSSSKMPFGGMGKSGNDRPSGHFAIQYCTVPVASLEDDKTFESKSVMPGLNFKFS